MTAIRAGDVVLHKPTGEEWLVAQVQGDRLAWCGWPPGVAQVADCVLVEAATDAYHVEVCGWVWPAGDYRRSMAARHDCDVCRAAAVAWAAGSEP